VLDEMLGDAEDQLSACNRSAMLSQYFTGSLSPTRRASQPLLHFSERADAKDIRVNLCHLAVLFVSRRFAQSFTDKQFVQIAAICGHNDCVVTPDHGSTKRMPPYSRKTISFWSGRTTWKLSPSFQRCGL